MTYADTRRSRILCICNQFVIRRTHIKKGQLIFDRNNDEIEILSDINTHITLTEECNGDF